MLSSSCASEAVNLVFVLMFNARGLLIVVFYWQGPAFLGPTATQPAPPSEVLLQQSDNHARRSSFPPPYQAIALTTR